MQIGLTRVSLNDVQGGELTSGIVPISRTMRGVFGSLLAFDAGIGLATTTIISLNCGTVVAGDVVILSATFGAFCDLGADTIRADLDLKPGTATVEMPSSIDMVSFAHRSVAINQYVRGAATLIGVVQVGGTWLPELLAQSQAFDGQTALANVCSLSAIVFYGG